MRPLASALVAVGVASAAAAATPASAAKRSAAVRPTQELAALLTSQRVYSAPDARRVRKGSLRASRPITGGQTVLPVVAHAANGDGRWLRVMLPGRPNGRKGWIRERGVVLSTTNWYLAVRTDSRRVRVFHRGRLVRTFSAIVGKPRTPTPRGRFFVEESVRMRRGSVGAPFALALSARSEVLQEFAGGPGQIALHGLENVGGTLGTAASHGCVRLSNRATTWLAARIVPGTPVTITR